MPEETLEFLRGGENDSFKLGINYDKNIDPDKAAFWQFITALLCFLFLVIYLTFYLSRCLGPIAGFLLTRFLRFKGSPGHIHIGSASVSLLAGKLMFRNFVYVCDDFCVKVNDGWIIFSYWWYIRGPRVDFRNTASRLHISLNGLQVHCYNRLEKYKEIARKFHLEKVFGDENLPDPRKQNKILIKKQSDDNWDRIWAFLGTVLVDVSSGTIIAGNELIPYMFILSFENLESKVALRESAHDRALLKVDSTTENVRASFLKHPEYEGPAVDEPPRTMGDGFAMLQTAKLEFFYEQDLLGFEVEDHQSPLERRPVWESVWRFGHNTVISYGPWVEQQRYLLYSFFFPADFQTAEVTEMPKKGERRVPILHDIRVTFLNETSLDLWFLRGEQLESMHTRCRQGSSFESSISWIIQENGFFWSTKVSLLDVESTTSLVIRRLLECETLQLKVDIHYPREFNAKQTWTVCVRTSKPTMWMVWDHKRFFQDLINEWVGDAPSDLAYFVPYSVIFDVAIQDNFELILTLNEGNWVDTTGGLYPEGVEAAIVGEKLQIGFTLPFDDFLPKTTKVTYTMKAETDLALRVRLPTQSTVAPVMSSLFYTSNPDKFAASSSRGNISKDPSWFEMWRTERIEAKFFHEFHPILGKINSDLPYHVIEEFVPHDPDHPREFEPDVLDVSIDIDASMVIVTGMVVKFILELKNNYFGLYDQLSDVADAGAEPQLPGLFGKVNMPVAYYRPIDITLTLRVHNVRAHALTHMSCAHESRKNASERPDICPVLFTEQLVVEMKKGFKETMVQVGLGTCVAYFNKGSTTERDGFVDLSGLQFRGHAFFSHIDVPWDMAVTEYAWIMEVILGDIKARLQPGHVIQLAQFLDSFLLVAMAPDEECRLPDRFSICQHGSHPARCKRKESDRNCPSEEHLKYRHLRVALNSAKLEIAEHRSALMVEVQPVRVALCNIHEGHYVDTLTVKLSGVVVRQLVQLHEHSKIWVEGARIGLTNTNLSIHLPLTVEEFHLEQARRKFIAKHDEETKRIHFFHRGSAGCACLGGTRFFADEDLTGRQFLQPNSNLAQPSVNTIPVPEPDAQPAFLQSILRKDESMFSTPRKTAYQKRHVRIDMLGRGSMETCEFKSEHGSTPSFYSAVSNNMTGVSSIHMRPLLECPDLLNAYSTFLDHYELVPLKLEMPQLGEIESLSAWSAEKEVSVRRVNKKTRGVGGLRLRTTEPTNSTEIVDKTQAEDAQGPKDGDEDEYKAHVIGVRGQLSDSCEVVMSPLGLEAFDRVLTSIARTLTNLHPAYLAQALYRHCGGTRHRQPLTASLFDDRTPLNSLFLHCKVPPVHICMLSCGNTESSQQVSSGVLLARFDASRVSTHLTPGGRDTALRLTFKRQGEAAVQYLHFVEKKRMDFSTNRVPLRNVFDWADVELGKEPPSFDLRPVFDASSPELEIAVDMGDSAAGGEKKIVFRLGRIDTTFMMAKPLEMTARNEFPVFDVLSPAVSSWFSVVDRVLTTASQMAANFLMYKDMRIAELLEEALESNDDRVLKAGKTCMGVVKKHHRNLASCPSCNVVLALLRYSAIRPSKCDALPRDVGDFKDQSIRKVAITALLSHWQTVMCNHVKLASNEDASKYLEQVDDGLPIPKGANKKKEMAPLELKRSKDKQREVHEEEEGDERKLSHAKTDLYQYVRRAHRELKERYEGRRPDAPAHSEDINSMEISQLVFFYTFHQSCKLDHSFLDDLPLGLLHLRAEATLSEIVFNVVEQKLVSTSDLKNVASSAIHCLLQLKTVHASGKVRYFMEMDERKLRPVSVKIDGDYSCDVGHMGCAVAISSVCLVKELTLVAIAVSDVNNELNRLRGGSGTPGKAEVLSLPSIQPTVPLDRASAISLSSMCPPFEKTEVPESEYQPWMKRVLDKTRDFQKFYLRRGITGHRGDVQLNVSGEVSLTEVRLNSILTDLCVSVWLQQIGLKHVDNKSDAKGPRDLSKVTLFLRRAALTILESEGRGRQQTPLHSGSGKDKAESKGPHILNCILHASNATMARRMLADENVDTNVRVTLGAIEGDLPMAAHSLHDVVLKHGAQLEQQFNRLSAQPPGAASMSASQYSDQMAPREGLTLIAPFGSNHRLHLPPTTRGLATRKIVQVIFNFEVASVELTAQLLPSLRAKYLLDKIHSQGVTGEAAKWKADISKHEVTFTLVSAEGRVMSPEHFTLPLPKVTVDGKYNVVGEEGAPNTAKQLHYREGGYLDVVITLGHVDYTFTTDLLNQILFAEQSFRSELSLLISRLRSSKPMPFAPGPNDTPQPSKPLLFSLRVEGCGVPWLQLTASTPTSTAVRFTLDNLRATLTNRWVVKEIEGKERIFGAAEIQLSAKLGQLCKPAQFHEVAYELQEYASFMTQIRVENKEGTANSNYSYLIALNRPILLIKSMAFDKAVLLWLNYKNTYDYWRAERSKAERERMRNRSGQDKRAAIAMFSPQPSTGGTPEVDVNLSLSIQNGMYICMPLLGTEISDGMAALVISLEKSDVTVCVKKELACQAGFESFKVAFVDNYDEQSLSDNFFKTTGGSNYFFFPQGTYQFCSQASAAAGGDAEWVLSVRSQMQGMKIDLDQRIGKLTKMLVNTFSSFGGEEGEYDLPGGSVYSDSDFGEEDVKVLEDAAELKNIPQPEGKIRWLERKMHEQSVLVSDLVQCKAKEATVEAARRKLRQLELIRFKQFRRSMIEKWRRNRAAAVYKKPISGQRSLEPPLEPSPSPKRQAAENPSGTVTVNPSVEKSPRQETQVNMHIDVQVNIASGSCFLRTQPKEPPAVPGFVPSIAKKPSTKDLRKVFSLQPPPSTVTTFSIPSVDVKGYYASADLPSSSPLEGSPGAHTQSTQSSGIGMSSSASAVALRSAPREIQRVRRLPSAASSGRLSANKEPQQKRGCIYLNVALASMPTETLVTPHLADFLEQVLEPLPTSNMFRSGSVNTIPESVHSDDSGPVPIVAIDTSVLPLDVILCLTVQSSTIRFDGQQQRSSAADCLLKLPCLTLMASTRRMDGAEYLGGVDISVTLSAFSLAIYSPHQQSTSHDALSVTLDHLSFVISRSKNSSQEPDNKVRFVLTANVGSASFNYDMRRLSELIAFPKPWYRAAIMRRVFFGDQSVKPPTPPGNSRPSSRLSPAPNRPREGDKAWSATVQVAVQWKELNVFAQMSNTMGNTTWKARDGVLRGYTKLNSRLERDASVLFKLKSSELSAHGGAISGQIAISLLRLSATHIKKLNHPPQNCARAQLSSISARVEWMSRAILIASCTSPFISLSDEWAVVTDTMGQVTRASVTLAVEGRWDDLQLVITRVTVDDIIKIANKLTAFFQEQLRSSKIMWGNWDERVSSSETPAETPTAEENHAASRFWEKVLDALTSIQMRHKLLPLPTSSSGETVVGGSVQFEAGRISLACMHGEMNANSWALFHMRQPRVLFTPEALYSFVDETASAVGVSMRQKLILRLGPDSPTPQTSENLATVCRVQSGSSVMRQNASIEACLEYVIGRVLQRLQVPPMNPVESQAVDTTSPAATEVRGQHAVLELFQFPALEAVLTSYQINPCSESGCTDALKFVPQVRSSFVCDFHNAVHVQTNFNAQVSFLPELLKSYMKNSGDGPAPQSTSTADSERRDMRQFHCEQWTVAPRICFIDRVKWTPPVIDDVLRKLQIFDHRTTIPKALQRGVLDPLDVFLAVSLKELLDMAAKG